MFDPTDPGPDYTLAWPPTLVRSEAEALLRRNARGWSGDAQWLLEEAFVSSVPRDELATKADRRSTFGDPVPFAEDEAKDVLRALAQHVDILPRAAAPAPYWRDRHGAGRPAPFETDGERELRLKQAWTRLAGDLVERGYLDSAAPDPAVSGGAARGWVCRVPLLKALQPLLQFSGRWDVLRLRTRLRRAQWRGCWAARTITWSASRD